MNTMKLDVMAGPVVPAMRVFDSGLMTGTASKRSGAFFGRRKGHALRPRQAALLETSCRDYRSIWPIQPRPICRTLFDGVDDVRLESGFGSGEHLTAEASATRRSASSASSRS